MPISLSFIVHNHNNDSPIELSKISLTHEYSYYEDEEKLSTVDFMLSVDKRKEEDLLFDYVQKRKNDIFGEEENNQTLLDNNLLLEELYSKNKTRTVKYVKETFHTNENYFIDLGVYTANHKNLGFLLEDSTVTVNPGERMQISFSFLLKKELVNTFKYLEFGETIYFWNTSTNVEQKLLPSLYFGDVDGINIEDIYDLNLFINFLFIHHDKKESFLVSKSWIHSK